MSPTCLEPFQLLQVPNLDVLLVGLQDGEHRQVPALPRSPPISLGASGKVLVVLEVEGNCQLTTCAHHVVTKMTTSLSFPVGEMNA